MLYLCFIQSHLKQIEMEILKQKAKQSWSSDQIVVIVGSSVVAYFGYDRGNGLNYEQAIAVAKQVAESWNKFNEIF